MDPTIAPRHGEEIDAAALRAWLGDNLPAGGGPLVVEQFPSGHSNLTYLLKLGGEEMVLRRPPHGSTVKTAHDMGREYRVLSRLHAVYPPAPRPLAYCDDPSVLGAPFYVMERRRGIAIRKEIPEPLAGDPDTLRRLGESVVDRLVELHQVDYRAAGLGDLGKPEGYVRRQIEGWTTRWYAADTGPLKEMNELAQWLSQALPPERGAAVIHNDYKLDNILLDPQDVTRIVAVLDWEMATIGDPLMDLGTSLSYWTDAEDSPELLDLRFVPKPPPGFLTRSQVVERYALQSKIAVNDVLYYYVYGLFKVAVILQQIFLRYAHGLTHDVRFAGLRDVVRALARQGVLAVTVGSISPRP